MHLIESPLLINDGHHCGIVVSKFLCAFPIVEINQHVSHTLMQFVFNFIVCMLSLLLIVLSILVALSLLGIVCRILVLVIILVVVLLILLIVCIVLLLSLGWLVASL